MVVKSKIKYINSLGDKKLRDAERVFVAEGPKIINELLDDGSIKPKEIFATRDWINNYHDASEVTEVDDVMLSRLSFLTTPNQVVGIFHMPELPPIHFKNKVTVVADGIQDPGNLGTIIRCADWFGIDQVICSTDTADIYNPKSVQASMGSVARVKVYYTDLVQVLTANEQLYSLAAALDGKDIRDVPPLKEGLIIIGNESKGIRSNVLALAKQRITIPGDGKAESLNAAIATGIILSHLIPSRSRS